MRLLALGTEFLILLFNVNPRVNSEPALFEVRVGEHSLRQTEPSERVHSVIDIISHPDYDDETLANDIRLMRVDPPIQFSPAIQSVCMPAADPPEGTSCNMAGWGSDVRKSNTVNSLMFTGLMLAFLRQNHVCRAYYLRLAQVLLIIYVHEICSHVFVFCEQLFGTLKCFFTQNYMYMCIGQ